MRQGMGLMATGDENSPYMNADSSYGESSGLSGSTALVPVPVALHQMHDGRVVSHAGRMTSGSLVPVPPVDAMRHSSGGRRWMTTVTVALAALIFTVGSAALITGAIQKSKANRAARAETGSRTVAESRPRAEAPVQTLAISEMRPSPSGADVPSAIKTQPIKPVTAKNASNLSVASIAGFGGETLPVKVSVQRGQAEDYSFVMFRGVPSGVTISSGFRVKESWAVALQDLGDLTIATPADYEGAFNLDVVLIKGRDTPAEKRAMPVKIQRRGGATNVSAAKPDALASAPIVTASLSGADRSKGSVEVPRARPQQPRPPLTPAQESAILEKAAGLITENDLVGARLLFEYLANRGSAKAALALGQTFDPAFFRTVKIVGLEPDSGMAKNWYQKAAELGNKEAAGRLSALAAQ